jgi:hypothetical protein
MAKGVQKVKGKKGPVRKQPVAGDLYQLTTDLEVADVNEDGVSDLTFSHSVAKNNEAWVDAKVVWYGLPAEVSGAFVEALQDVGFVDEEVVETNKVATVVKHWKNLTKALQKINKLGEELVKAVGEEVEED